MMFERYESYKDSEVEWLGDVPEGWDVGKLKDISFYQEGPGIMANDFQKEGVPLIRISGMKGDSVSLDGCNFLDPAKVNRKWAHFQLNLGELLVSASASTGIVAKTNDLVVGAIPYTGLIRFKPRYKLNLGYLQYFLTSNIFIYQIDLQKTGTTIQHYGPTHLGRIVSIKPPLIEQKSIADYLDHKTSQIDQEINLLTQKAEQYSQLKQSLINETVTRGLDKTVTLKDSGVEWVGDIPEHWHIKRIKEISEVNKNSLSDKTPIDYEFEYIDIGSVTYGVKGYLTEKMIFESSPSRAKRIVEKGDTIISTVRTYLKAITSIDEDVQDLIVSTGFAVISPKTQLDNKYCSYLLTSEFIIDEISAKSKGVSYPAITATEIGDLLFLMPPIKEQKKISIYLDKKTSQIDQITQTINNKINKLKELRKTLINDVVTGKIKVVN